MAIIKKKQIKKILRKKLMALDKFLSWPFKTINWWPLVYSFNHEKCFKIKQFKLLYLCCRPQNYNENSDDDGEEQTRKKSRNGSLRLKFEFFAQNKYQLQDEEFYNRLNDSDFVGFSDEESEPPVCINLWIKNYIKCLTVFWCECSVQDAAAIKEYLDWLCVRLHKVW